MSSATDPYKILGLTAQATEAEIKQAYRKLVRQWHPDQFQAPREKQKAEAEIKRINIAYSQLKDANFRLESCSSPSASHAANQASASGGATVQKDSKAKRQARAQNYYRQARTLEQVERYQDATKALTLAINLVPDYAEAYQYRAYLYDLRGFEFLAAKDKKRANTLGLEKVYRSTAPGQAKSTARSSSHASSRSSSTASSSGQTRASKAANPEASRRSDANAVNSTSVFSCPQPMAAVNQTWNCTATLKSPTGAITQLLPYGSTNGISASANGLIQLWNFERGYDFADLKGHSDEILDLDLNSDGQLLASASKDGTVKLWHLSSASLTRSFPTGTMESLIFGPERHSISCCNSAGEVRQWNSSQESSNPKANPAPASQARWANHATTYLGLSDNRQILLRRSSDRILHRDLLQETHSAKLLPGSQFEQTAIALSPSSRHIAAGDRTGLIRLWNLQTAEPIMAIQGQAGVVEAIAFTSDNRLIASLCRVASTATSNGETLVQLWSRSSREHLCDIPGNGFTSLCFSGDSKRLIVGTTAGELQIWQPAARA